MSDLKGIDNASFSSKETFTLPPGANIIKKTYSIRVEEIENGFIVCKNYDIKYQNLDGNTEYAYVCKKWFAKENPMKIEVDDSEVPLEDKID